MTNEGSGRLSSTNGCTAMADCGSKSLHHRRRRQQYRSKYHLFQMEASRKQKLLKQSQEKSMTHEQRRMLTMSGPGNDDGNAQPSPLAASHQLKRNRRVYLASFLFNVSFVPLSDAIEYPATGWLADLSDSFPASAYLSDIPVRALQSLSASLSSAFCPLSISWSVPPSLDPSTCITLAWVDRSLA